MISSAQPPKKLILHLDVNQTIIMTCIGKSLSYIITCSLAEDIQYKDIWENDLSEMTYYEYITEHKLKSYQDTPEFRAKTIEEITNFIPFLEKNNHRFYSEIQKRHDACVQKMENAQGKIVAPSFYNLITWLEEEKQDYKLLLRTFGADGDAVVKELQQYTKLDFIKAEFDQKEAPVSDLSQMYDYWLNIPSHIAIKDNYARWDNHKEHWRYGKHYPYERYSQQNISVFFDDNIKAAKHNPQRGIITPYDVDAKEFVEPATALAEGNAYCVQPVKVIEDDNYFIAKVQNTLALVENKSKTFTPMLNQQNKTAANQIEQCSEEKTAKAVFSI